MRVASGPFPYFELIEEYEAPPLNLQLDDFNGRFQHLKKGNGRIPPPLQISQKAPKK
jgi:hypothetical protein